MPALEKITISCPHSLKPALNDIATTHGYPDNISALVQAIGRGDLIVSRPGLGDRMATLEHRIEALADEVEGLQRHNAGMPPLGAVDLP